MLPIKELTRITKEINQASRNSPTNKSPPAKIKIAIDIGEIKFRKIIVWIYFIEIL